MSKRIKSVPKFAAEAEEQTFWEAPDNDSTEYFDASMSERAVFPNLKATMDAILDVVKVEAKPDYKLFLEFENGEKRVFDMSPYMDKRPFVRLKGSPLFARATVDYGTVVWPGVIDIAPETLYDKSRPV